MSYQLTTPRLILRPWQSTDREPFAQLNADPRVMTYMPRRLTHELSNALVDRLEAHFVEHDFGLWAVELRQTGKFMGFIGLQRTTFVAPFTPCVEISWRLAAAHWGQGYATEGARAALSYGFEVLQLPEIVSFTTRENQRSRRVMEKLGLCYCPQEDFNHPLLPGNPLAPHVLYRLSQADWSASCI
jgi:RimJ/RimL family protein N-acetyltransferase